MNETRKARDEMQRDTTAQPTRYFYATLADGRHVQCFVNVETGLVVVDVVDADERGGVEIFRGIV